VLASLGVALCSKERISSLLHISQFLMDRAQELGRFSFGASASESLVGCLIDLVIATSIKLVVKGLNSRINLG